MGRIFEEFLEHAPPQLAELILPLLLLFVGIVIFVKIVVPLGGAAMAGFLSIWGTHAPVKSADKPVEFHIPGFFKYKGTLRFGFFVVAVMILLVFGLTVLHQKGRPTVNVDPPRQGDALPAIGGDEP